MLVVQPPGPSPIFSNGKLSEAGSANTSCQNCCPLAVSSSASNSFCHSANCAYCTDSSSGSCCVMAPYLVAISSAKLRSVRASAHMAGRLIRSQCSSSERRHRVQRTNGPCSQSIVRRRWSSSTSSRRAAAFDSSSSMTSHAGLLSSTITCNGTFTPGSLQNKVRNASCLATTAFTARSSRTTSNNPWMTSVPCAQAGPNVC